MKIINATWEKRNLGCDAYEIQIERKDFDNFDAVCDEIEKQDFSGAYVVIKMPVGNLDALHKLQDMGFYFMETQLGLEKCFDADESLWELIENAENVSYTSVPKTPKAWDQIIEKITPYMFSTDRVSLDPQLGPEIACLRYKNWAKDLFADTNSRMFEVNVEGIPVAFGINVVMPEKRIDYGILGGVYKEFDDLGYGLFLIAGDKGLNALHSGEKCRTTISSNNFKILKIYQKLGYVIYKELYVLRKFY